MILVVNSGSSSIKIKLFELVGKEPTAILEGIAERIGIDGVLKIEYKDQKYKFDDKMLNHDDAIKIILEKFIELKVIKNKDDITAIGFRVVHGGNITKAVIIDEEVQTQIENCVKLAPLHNPAAIVAIEAFKKEMPSAKLVACFDTAFHQSIDEENFLYSVPYDWYEKYQVRKFGFHGISYEYITEKMSSILNKKEKELNLIVCHLGNGASIACIEKGKSIDTSMGLTPLAGLIMGTRSGDIDPSIHEYMAKELNTDIYQITKSLNKDSGLLGISKISSDMRDVLKEYELGNKLAVIAVNKYCQTVADFVVKYANKLKGKIDGIVFTAGIGENSDTIRKIIIDKVNILGLELDENKNQSRYEDYNLLSNANSRFEMYSIKTNEELMICKNTLKLSS